MPPDAPAWPSFGLNLPYSEGGMDGITPRRPRAELEPAVR
jgi:hypothetical protein